MICLASLLLAKPLEDLRFDSMMMDGSTRGMTEMTLQLHDATNMLYWSGLDDVDDRWWILSRVYKGFLGGLAWTGYHVGRIYTVSLHEYGHGSRAMAFGYDVSYSVAYKDGKTDKVSSYYELLRDMFKSIPRGIEVVYMHSSGSKKDNLPLRDEDIPLIKSAGGVNAEMQLAAAVEQRFYERKRASVYDVFPYLAGKKSIYNYIRAEEGGLENGDMSRVIKKYEEKGIDVSFDELKTYNTYAMLLSGSFWALVNGWVDYVYTGEDEVRVKEYRGFQWPDVNMYLTRFGPTYHVQTGYRVNDKTRIPFAVETTLKGESKTDYSVGLHRRWLQTLYTKTELRVGDQLGLSQEVQFNVSKRWTFEGGVQWMDFRNFYGERQGSLSSTSYKSTEVWIGMRVDL
ncbi:hypothetical protein DID78_06470 [Candidatus Marinamargulisbacteria bacterium SCGC AG-343-D04]|nr:hypothetical protein DID78_06470 [Candidatus Marinamargulisbacteria bacterium SCGC AG-343-D04]